MILSPPKFSLVAPIVFGVESRLFSLADEFVYSHHLSMLEYVIRHRNEKLHVHTYLMIKGVKNSVQRSVGRGTNLKMCSSRTLVYLI